jgi:hypothetical protein
MQRPDDAPLSKSMPGALRSLSGCAYRVCAPEQLLLLKGFGPKTVKVSVWLNLHSILRNSAQLHSGGGQSAQSTGRGQRFDQCAEWRETLSQLAMPKNAVANGNAFMFTDHHGGAVECVAAG